LFDAVIPFGRHRCYWKSHYLAGLGDGLIDTILAANASPPSPNTLSSIWNFGGATAAVPADATAFGDRSMPYMLSLDAIWSEPAADDANIAWARGWWERLRPHAQEGRVYLNFPGRGEEGEALVRSTFGANYGRLRAIKRKFDPENRFRFNQNIRPAEIG
jgi:FAD/FMN-containing dehydrogenase